MSVEYTHGEKRISLCEDISLKIISKSEECYFWDEVFVETKTETKKIGSYFTDPSSHERMIYNSNIIVFLIYDPYVSSIIITNIFDIRSNQIINGTQEELLEICDREFNIKENLLIRNKNL